MEANGEVPQSIEPGSSKDREDHRACCTETQGNLSQPNGKANGYRNPQPVPRSQIHHNITSCCKYATVLYQYFFTGSEQSNRTQETYTRKTCLIHYHKIISLIPLNQNSGENKSISILIE